MKRFLTTIIAILAVTLPTLATDWQKVTSTYYADMDTIKFDGDDAKIWVKFDGSKTEKYSSLPNVHWVYRLEAFNRNTNQHLTLNEIVYDNDMQIIENILNPYGSFEQTFSTESDLNKIKNVIFK